MSVLAVYAKVNGKTLKSQLDMTRPIIETNKCFNRERFMCLCKRRSCHGARVAAAWYAICHVFVSEKTADIYLKKPSFYLGLLGIMSAGALWRGVGAYRDFTMFRLFDQKAIISADQSNKNEEIKATPHTKLE